MIQVVDKVESKDNHHGGQVMIDTRATTKKEDLEQYVLDEYKSILFPKKKSKYMLDHEKAMH